jgi:selenide,water dikinase
MSLGDLAHVLRQLGNAGDPRLLVGPETFDDAGIVRLDDRRALVLTVDFFPPIVDDPYAFGAIAATNSLSDVYAMGGAPLATLNIAGFPEGFDREVIGQILRGGSDKVREAGAVLAGGHTIRSDHVFFGMAVTGLIDPERVVTNAKARPGDHLYLTKPLGMGAASTAIKSEALSPAGIEAAQRQMATLNADAAAAMNEAGAHACTDVTGYGLLGHARNIALASDVSLAFDSGSLPIFPESEALARKGILSGGAKRGRDALAELVEISPAVPRWKADLCFDAETSGGLLISIPPEKAQVLERGFARRGVPGVRIGRVEPKNGARLRLL